MQERRIDVINENNLERVNRPFVTKDFLKQADIDEMAEKIKDVIKEKISTLESPEQKMEIILHFLEGSQILENITMLKQAGFSVKRDIIYRNPIKLSWKDQSGKTQSDTITIEELEPFLRRIRELVLDKLSPFLPPSMVLHIVKKVQDPYSKEPKLELENNLFYKREDYRMLTSTEQIETEKRNHSEALKYLYNIKERSPFIYYGIHTLDSRQGATIGNFLKVTNLSEILANKPKPPLQKMLGYLLDAIEGHKFLLAHDLVLFDNHNENIFINNETDTGLLLDLGGLRRKNDKAILTSPHTPPERLGYVNGVITEANIVYELGLTLSRILFEYGQKETNLRLKYLHALAAQMESVRPQNRPTLEDIEGKLRKIMQTA